MSHYQGVVVDADSIASTIVAGEFHMAQSPLPSAWHFEGGDIFDNRVFKEE